MKRIARCRQELALHRPGRTLLLVTHAGSRRLNSERKAAVHAQRLEEAYVCHSRCSARLALHGLCLRVFEGGLACVKWHGCPSAAQRTWSAPFSHVRAYMMSVYRHVLNFLRLGKAAQGSKCLQSTGQEATTWRKPSLARRQSSCKMVQAVS